MTDTFAAGLVTCTFAAVTIAVIAVGWGCRERWRRLDSEAGIAAVRAASDCLQAEMDRQERRLIPSRN